jgi:hypothetical protein
MSSQYCRLPLVKQPESVMLFAGIRHRGMPQHVDADPQQISRTGDGEDRQDQQLYDEKLSALPGVQRLSSTLVMKTVVAERSFLPLGK